ncbi:hypothetical protein Dimus_011160 [Dionaea muscipula]
MAYVINTPHHELPYGELLNKIFHDFDVPLDDKEAEQAVKTDYYNEIFLGMCELRRDNEVWWLEKEKEDRSARSTLAAFEWEQVEEATEVKRDFTTATDQPIVEKKFGQMRKDRGVDPSGTTPDYDLIHLQAEINRALKASTRFQELLQQIKPTPPTSPRP